MTSRVAGLLMFVLGLGAASRSFAAFEDLGSGAAPAAMGEALGAVPMGAASVDYNPAGLGEARAQETQAGYKTSASIPAAQPQGPGAAALDFNQISAAAAVALGKADAFGLSGQYVHRGNLFLDRSAGATYATWKWKETDYGYLDFGVTAKALVRSSRLTGSRAAAGAADAGVMLRLEGGRTIGASVFNVNRPKLAVDGFYDRAPLMGRIGCSQTTGDLTMSVDVVKREADAGAKGGQALEAGLQYWLRSALPRLTRRGGAGENGFALAGRTGLNLGDAAKSWSLGLGWKALGAEADFAVMVPLASRERLGNAVSLLFHFGDYNPEREYEKVLGRELELRQELARILDRSEKKQKELAQDLADLRAEIAALKTALADKTAQESAVRERLRGYEQRERRARETLEAAERERRAAALRTKESLYREDWAAYRKLKEQPAPDAVLIERVQQILRQYKETGVDLSEANQELLRLLRNRP